MIRIIIAGARGKMGREAVALVERTEQFQLVGAVDYKFGGARLAEIDGFSADVPVFANLPECLQAVKADVLIDLTNPEVGRVHTKIAVEHGVRAVVGTTGFTDEDLAELKALAEAKQTGVIIAPNFAIGAILMMKFAQMAAKYFHDVEIIETHHDQKLDAPSGTAYKTAQLIAEVRPSKQQGHPLEKETLDGARGANFDGIHIHSVRLPGFVAHQQVIFGGEGQAFTLKHDSFHRGSFMSGVKLCVEHVMKSNTLTYGMEHIIE